MNPLLEDYDLPPFSKIKPEHVYPAVETVISENKAVIEKLLEETEKPTWENLVQPLDKLGIRFHKVWSPVGHMNAVVNSKELRTEYAKAEQLVSEFSTWMGQNKALYEAYLSIKESEAYKDFNDAKKKIINDAVQSFELSGVALPEDKKERFGKIQTELSKISTTFSDNVLDATMGWIKLVTDEKDLEGLPDRPKAAARKEAEKNNKEGWLFTLQWPSYQPVMTYCKNRSLREEMYTAFVTRASQLGPQANEFDNTEIIERILELRLEKAKLLGFSNHAEVSIAPKMAETTDQVLGFINDLASRCRAQGIEDVKALEEHAKTLGIDKLKSWDISYVAEKLLEHLYSFSQEEVRQYFEAEKTVNGMFEIVNRLYGIEFEEVEGIDTWDPEVRFYKILQNGEHIASFYFDLYARSNKKGGAWMNDCLDRSVTTEKTQLPVAYLVCNFSPPLGDKPSLLTHSEVVTLFHEFGHGLHHMLTEVDEVSASGINGVDWDAVELPSQFMENWCWEKEGLDYIARHWKTGDELPDALLQKMLAAKNFNSATAMLRQLQLASFDFRLHCEYGTDEYKGVQGTMEDVTDKITILESPDFNRFYCGFGHIFAGGYSAGYYSYKWAEVLSADAFSKFEEEGIFNRSTGKDFRENILAKGGSRKAAELFRNFRGRDPKIDALLRHQGISA